MTESLVAAVDPQPQIRIIPKDRPWFWLARGWHDLRRAPLVGLTIGFCYAALGAFLTWLTWERDVYYLTFPLLAGFLIVGPLAAVGLYETSRRLKKGKRVGLLRAVGGFRQNPTQIAFMGVILLIIYMAWVRVATLIFMGFFGMNSPGIEAWNFFEKVARWEHWPFYLVGNLVGGVFAVFTFAISAISIPLLMDRPNANAITAMVASFEAVRRNFWTLMLWAALICVFVGAGILTGFVGLIVALPLIGHATWAAYKELVAWPQD